MAHGTPNKNLAEGSEACTKTVYDVLSRVSALRVQGEGQDLVVYAYVGMGRYVRITYPEPDVDLDYVKESGAPDGDAGDPYTGYDRFGRTVDMRWMRGSAVRDRIQYGYDRAGNRTWRRNRLAGSGQDHAYGYDRLYQVEEAARGTLNLNRTAIGGIPAEIEDFAYDATGNWTRYTLAEDGTETLDQNRVSNRDNQLTQIDGSSDGLLYDRAGNALQLPPDADGDWNRHYQLSWDAWNRLVRIEDESGTPVATYAYDAAARRTTRVMGSETRHFYYNDQWKVIEERVESPSSSSSSSSSYDPYSSSSSSSYFPYSSSSSSSYPYYSSESSYSFAALAGSGSSGGSSNGPYSSQSSSSSPLTSSSSSSPAPSLSSSSSSSFSSVTPGGAAVQYLWGVRPQHRDELIRRDRDSNGNGVLDERLYCLMDYYSPTAMVNTSGNVLERYRFSAFGLRTVMGSDWTEKSALSYEVRFGFHGQFLDVESGYYDYGYRYYSPHLGRWLNRDPIEEGGGVNLYAFVGNNAVNALDRLGLSGSLRIGIKGARGVDPYGELARWGDRVYNAQLRKRKILRDIIDHFDKNGDGKLCCKDDEGEDAPWDLRMVGYSWGAWTALLIVDMINDSDKIESDCFYIELGLLDPVKQGRTSADSEASMPDFVKALFNIYQQNGCWRGCPAQRVLSYEGQEISGWEWGHQLDVSSDPASPFWIAENPRWNQSNLVDHAAIQDYIGRIIDSVG